GGTEKSPSKSCEVSLWFLLIRCGGEDFRQLHGKPRARHDLIDASRLRSFGEIGLNVRKKADDAKSGLHCAKPLNGIKRRGSGVEIDDDESGPRFEKLQQGISVGSYFHFETELLCGLGELHLKKEIIHVGYNVRHCSLVSVNG